MPDKNGKGPRKSSWMHKQGKRGKKAGRKKGNCK